MRTLKSYYRQISDECFDDLRKENVTSSVGPFELITTPALIQRYTAMLTALWTPIAGDYVGRLLSRYIRGVVGGIKGQPFWGRHGVDPYVVVHTAHQDLDLPGLCRYFLRRAIYLRQIALGTRRNFFTSRAIAKQTTDFVINSPLGRRIDVLYKTPAESGPRD